MAKQVQRAQNRLPQQPHMPVIGLLGGVASGKSLVAREFERLGAGVLDADRAGHEVLRSPEVESAARDRWGAVVFGDDGHIDRAKLAAIVFGPPPDGPRERQYLEQLTHPAIGERLRVQADQWAAAGLPAVVLDAPLLLEVGWDRLCDRLVFVDAPQEVRRKRALERGWNETEFAVREDAQESLDSKRQRADVVVDNSGSPDQTQAQIARLWHSLIG